MEIHKSVLNLQIGEKAKVIGFASKEIENYFLSFGLKPNNSIILKRKAPFGGSLYIQFNTVYMAIRRTEAASVMIQSI